MFIFCHTAAISTCCVLADGPDGGKEIAVFESGAIMMYLAEKYGKFMPTAPHLRTECFSWLFWQMAGQGPMTGALHPT